jgi:hypothetical protein
METVLARHGRPTLTHRAWISAADLFVWIQSWSMAKVITGEVPPITERRAAESGVILTSTLPRSIQSADVLGTSVRVVSEAVFYEADLPHPKWCFPRLPVAIWAVCFRMARFLGYSSNAESFALASARAQRCADRLLELARQHVSVFIVEHGIMTMLIAKQLFRRGWSGPTQPAKPACIAHEPTLRFMSRPRMRRAMQSPRRRRCD